jgi:hypothetical protein
MAWLTTNENKPLRLTLVQAVSLGLNQQKFGRRDPKLFKLTQSDELELKAGRSWLKHPILRDYESS